MKKTIGIILIVLVVLGAVGGGIFGIVKATGGSKFDTKKISNGAFSVGGLDGAGKYMSTNGSIYTKEAFECQGLEASLAFDNSVEYQIYFYDQNNDFVHTTGKLSRAFVKTEVPFFAKYARIVITPKDDDVVSKLEVRKYAKQLTVKVNREQGFKNYTDNLCEIEIEGASLKTADGSVNESESAASYGVSNFINISSYKEALVFRVKGTNLSGTHMCFYDASKGFIKYFNIGDAASLMFTSSDGINYYKIEFAKLDLDGKEASYIRVQCALVSFVEIYCR